MVFFVNQSILGKPYENPGKDTCKIPHLGLKADNSRPGSGDCGC